MVRYELQRLPGAPLQRGTVDAGTTLVSLLDSLQLHRDVIVKLNTGHHNIASGIKNSVRCAEGIRPVKQTQRFGIGGYRRIP